MPPNSTIKREYGKRNLFNPVTKIRFSNNAKKTNQNTRGKERTPGFSFTRSVKSLSNKHNMSNKHATRRNVVWTNSNLKSSRRGIPVNNATQSPGFVAYNGSRKYYNSKASQNMAEFYGKLQSNPNNTYNDMAQKIDNSSFTPEQKEVLLERLAYFDFYNE
jgi:hypothetical protein